MYPFSPDKEKRLRWEVLLSLRWNIDSILITVTDYKKILDYIESIISSNYWHYYINKYN